MNRRTSVVILVAALAMVTSNVSGEAPPVEISDVWTHAGETSAVVSCVTSSPAKAHVEYGPTTGYGSQAPGDNKPRYVHIIALTKLTPAQVVHCRIVVTAPDGTEAKSNDLTLRPARIEAAVRIPADVAGPPYVLDKADTTYVLTEDITSDGTAFRILANGVKLDLDGHTVRYGKDLTYEEPLPTTAWLKSGHGVFFPRYGIRNVTILNGTLQEATAKQRNDPSGYGHNPICGNGVSGMEVAAVTFAYEGKDIRGINLSNSSGAKIHHCIFDDAGTHITNRHQGLDAVPSIGKSDVHHNLIRRVRHRAISAGSQSKVHHNEIHCDSWATNAYGVMCFGSKNAEVHHNYIFGGGYHLVGVGTVSNAANVKVHHNHIELTGSTPTDRWAEYGKISGMNGVRTTWGGSNLEYYNNTIIITGSGGSNLRGTWFSSAPDVRGLVFRDNFVRVVALDDQARVRGAISVCGDYTKTGHSPVVYRNNRIISNVTNVRFGEGYGLGCNARLYGNTFVREGEDPRYKTIGIGYWDKRTTGHILRDSKFEGGASLDHVKFSASGDRDFTVQWTVTIRVLGPDGEPLAGAEVVVTDKAGAEVFRGKTDGAGQAAAALTQYVHKPEGKTPHTPHTVTVTLAGYAKATQALTADAAKTVDVNLK